MNTNLMVVVEPVLVDRIRERADRILSLNSSNTAKALAKDSLALLGLLDRAALVKSDSPLAP